MWGELALVAGLVLVQALLVLPLFAGEFTQHRGSIEATFIANAQFIVDHFPDLAWEPYWYLGFPFEWFYTPLLPALVAIVGKLGGDVPHAYRLVSATGLAIGPAALYLAARELTRSRWVATIAAFAFIFVPSLSYALPNIYPEAHAFSGAIVPPPWRLVAMVEFGEGPHIASLSLALLAVAATIRYLRLPSAGRLALAVALLVAVALTNLIGAFGAAILLLGVAASRHPSMPSERRIERLFRVALLTTLFSAGWYSLGFIQHFAQPGGDDRASFYLALPIVALIAVIAIRELSSPRLPAGADVVVGWIILFGLIVGLKQVLGLGIAPQPIRYAPELDAAFAVGLAIFLVAFADQLLRRYRPERNRRFAVTVFCVLLFLAMGLPGWNAVRPKLAADEGWESWSERTVALWLRDHLGPGERAYLSGDHAFWLNVFAPEVAQVKGGQDFAAENPWYAHASFQINTGADKDISLAWLQALPARYVVVPGPASSEIYRDFSDPAKFDGVLPVAFQSGGVRIYDVGATPTSSFGTLPAGRGTTVPENGIDREAIAAHAADAAMARPALSFVRRGTSAWEARVDIPEAADGWFRSSYDAGWRVRVDGRAVATRADGIGELRFAIPAGSHAISAERRPRFDFLAGLIVALGTALTLTWRRLRRETLPARGMVTAFTSATGAVSALATSVIGIGLLLGAWTGFPKGSDAPAHLTRLKFVADWLPNHHWLYVWAAGMPTFETYPALLYLVGFVPTKVFGPEAALLGLTVLAMVSFVVGLYAFLAAMTGSRLAAFAGAFAAISSMAIWTWLVNNGLYARLFASGIGVWAWYAHERWLRTGGRRPLVATSALIAATIASHAFMGIVFTGVIALRTVFHRPAVTIRGFATLVGIALLLAAPAVIPVLTAGTAGRFFGAAHGPHVITDVSALWASDNVGPAVPFFLLAAVVATLARRRRPPLLFVGLTALTLGYLFAPSFGVPNSLYYVNGIDPFTVTYLVTIFAACAGAMALAHLSLSPPVGAVIMAVTGVVAMGGTIAGVDALVRTNPQYPQVFDAASPERPSGASERAIALPADLGHRVMPSTADEAGWMSYRSRMPQLRDYYGQGQVQPDWLAFAYVTMFDAPYDPRVAAVVRDWYGISLLTVDGASFGANLVALQADPDLRNSTLAPPYQRFDLPAPTSIAVVSTAPIVLIQGNDEFYRQVVRTVFREGLGPDRVIPIHWRRPLAELDPAFVDRIATLVLGQNDPDERSATVARGVADRGGVVLADLDAISFPSSLATLLPVTESLVITYPASWGFEGDGSVNPLAFAPALFEGGPWKAAIGTGLRAGAQRVLWVGDKTVVATRAQGAGVVVLVGGNLLFHADYAKSQAERAFLLRWLTASATGVSADLPYTFTDPEHRVVEATGASLVLLKESLAPGWSASLRTATADRALPIYEAGPGLMAVLVPTAGTVSWTYGLRWTEWLAWVLWMGGIALAVQSLRSWRDPA